MHRKIPVLKSFCNKVLIIFNKVLIINFIKNIFQHSFENTYFEEDLRTAAFVSCGALDLQKLIQIGLQRSSLKKLLQIHQRRNFFSIICNFLYKETPA